jgi:acylphosphatase
MESMKLKIKISGPNVHNVGYRYFLMTNALDMGLRGFQARNRICGNDQEVIALVEGDDEAIADFEDLVETRKPEHSKISNIDFEGYEGDVMKTENYAQICSAIQLNKAIPVLLEIRDGVNAVRKTGEDTLSEIKVMRKTTDATLNEIKGMREDVQPGFASHFKQVQADVRAIKERLGMQ